MTNHFIKIPKSHVDAVAKGAKMRYHIEGAGCFAEAAYWKFGHDELATMRKEFPALFRKRQIQTVLQELPDEVPVNTVIYR